MSTINIPKLSTLSVLFCGMFYLPANAQNLEFSGNSIKVLEYVPEANTGLNKIYVPYTTDNLSAKFYSSNPTAVRWMRYSNLGGGFAEEINTAFVEGEYSVLPNIDGDMGYIIEDGDKRYFYWIVDYKPKRFSIKTVAAVKNNDCDYSTLQVDGKGEAIHYFTINGQQRTLSRDITVEYETEEWNSTSKIYEKVPTTKVFESLTVELMLPAALCSTYFTISGDRFLKEWNWLDSAETTVVAPHAVASQATAEQTNTTEEGSNQMKVEGSDFGGSAPADITFTAYTTEGVLHNEWQMSRDANFDNIEYRFSVDELDYTFNQEGTYYLRYVGSNSDGSCETITDTFTVNIGTSDLKCPNVFSPDGDGVNDEWKVSYRSIIEFKCWIFDRNGQQITVLDSPEKGWDGKYHGKLVNPGVYYYVIQAKGADGKKYKKSGDINILRHRNNSTVTGGVN